MRLQPPILRPIARDVRQTTEFMCAREARKQARAALPQCATPEEFWSFTHHHFVRGAAQNRSEISALVRYAAAIKPRVVCEIGVQDGGTNFILCRALPTVTTIIGVDLYVALKAQLRYFRRPDLALHIVEGSSHSARTRRRVTQILRSRPIDLLFIDGDHTYDGAFRDWMLYSPLVRAGGLIAFHDIVEDSFTRSGIRTESYVGDVPALWNRIRRNYPNREFIDHADQDGRGIGVVRYDPSINVPSLDAI